jgi:hypothetical protein
MSSHTDVLVDPYAHTVVTRTRDQERHQCAAARALENDRHNFIIQ